MIEDELRAAMTAHEAEAPWASEFRPHVRRDRRRSDPRERCEVGPPAVVRDRGEGRDVRREPGRASQPDGEVRLRTGQGRPQRVVEGMGHVLRNRDGRPRLPCYLVLTTSC